jgi:heme-degrading monooxygenase HmoA
MLTSTWESETDAQRWLHGTSFTRTAAALRSIEGTVARVEQYRRRATLDSNGINVS